MLAFLGLGVFAAGVCRYLFLSGCLLVYVYVYFRADGSVDRSVDHLVDIQWSLCLPCIRSSPVLSVYYNPLTHFLPFSLTVYPSLSSRVHAVKPKSTTVEGSSNTFHDYDSCGL
ncbi:hypothetical protein BKA65DRAFT_193752 [Rhexocercosporidium sp. MPI-PUGE-AT-0058]|nr:hypothetical protein BKA65DRAFT_193752 [Rhexocercosporidium sp. MPI-PUGE-AT-0058]